MECYFNLINKQNKQNGSKEDCRIRKKYTCYQDHIKESWPQEGRWKAKEEKNWNFLSLHLQSSQASSPRNWNLKEVNEHYELIHQWYLRKDRPRIIKACQIQQEAHPLKQRGTNCCKTPPSRWTCQACRLRRNKGSHKVQQCLTLSFAIV